MWCMWHWEIDSTEFVSIRMHLEGPVLSTQPHQHSTRGQEGGNRINLQPVDDDIPLLRCVQSSKLLIIRWSPAVAVGSGGWI